MTAILVLGAPELPGLAAALGGTGTCDGATLPLPKEGAVLDARTVVPLLDRAAALLASHESLIVVHPASAGGRATALLSTVRAVLDDAAIAPVASRLGPVGTSTLAAVLARLAETGMVAAGSLIAGSAGVESQLLSLAWLPTVTGLDLPDLSMADHIRSFLPNSAFAVLMSPQRRLIRIGDNDAELELPTSLGYRPIVVMGGAAALPAWVSSNLLRRLNPATVLNAADGPHLTEWWGTPRALELAAVPADVTPWAAHLAAAFPTRPCRWCGVAGHGPSCPFCEFVGWGMATAPRPRPVERGPGLGPPMGPTVGPETLVAGRRRRDH